MKTCNRVLRTSAWGKGSPSNRTTTLSTQPRQHRSGFGTSLWTSLSGPARAQTSTQSNISGDTWKSCAVTLLVQPDRAWEDLQRRNGEKLPKYRCAKLVVSYPRRFKAVIAAKGASTKYWVKGLNTYVYKIYKCAKMSINLFLHFHYGLLCVDWWGEKKMYSYGIRLWHDKIWEKSKGLNTFRMPCMLCVCLWALSAQFPQEVSEGERERPLLKKE